MDLSDKNRDSFLIFPNTTFKDSTEICGSIYDHTSTYIRYTNTRTRCTCNSSYDSAMNITDVKYVAATLYTSPDRLILR
jgi:hypothetical protein